ncbi:glycine-rich RNA-binding protein 3, mitochondrial-like [Penaeus monodon]|uniref:glycine-rich RNA-binding protein 3, mitochondrial-like n=1 Tax=Penaeus monodon TaxID=6687 RepID=UPI0018A7DA0E|nr:glycine-rich RNA-binding protein 3, mitochondrial-like [Penaeus monodon]
MNAILLVVAVVLGVSSASRVRRGGISVGGGLGGDYAGVSGGYAGYTGSTGGVNVLLAGGGGGYGGYGGSTHVLNAGGGVAFYPSAAQQQPWYYNIAQGAGDAYSAKTIAAGDYAIQTADAAALGAAHGVLALANDAGFAGTVNYLTQHAQDASLGAAAHSGAAHVVVGAAGYH